RADSCAAPGYSPCTSNPRPSGCIANPEFEMAYERTPHSFSRSASIVLNSRCSRIFSMGRSVVNVRATDPLWYKDAIIYETHVKAFFDSNRDGIGDFPGLIEKLDYLQDLGVTCLWLLPFFPSPLRDDGYDIADYENVHPSYGTIDDFKRLLAAAHDRNLHVIIELVINHTSNRHSWFQRAREAPPNSPERDFYVWSDTDKKYS